MTLQPGQFHQPKLPGMEHIANHGPVMPTMGGQYLRFGHWPADERSRNNVTGGKEEGVSVYDLHPHTNEPIDPDPHWRSDHAEQGGDPGEEMHGRVADFHRGRHPAFVVTGKEAGVGWDAEPVLNSVKHLRDWEGPVSRWKHRHVEARR